MTTQTSLQHPVEIKTYTGRRKGRKQVPFKSKSQRRKFRAMLARGEITEEQYREWERATPANIPEHKKKRKKGKGKA